MKILLADPFAPDLPGRLAMLGELSQDLQDLPEAELLIVRSRTRVDQALLGRASRLRLILRGGVGMDNIDLQACEARHIRVLNTPRVSAVSVAELTMAFMLAVSSHLIEAHNSMMEGRFLKKELLRAELFGKTLGLVGVGSIATEVARRASAFGMRLLGYDPHLNGHPVVTLVGRMDELLPECDYLSLHLPAIPETRGFIHSGALAGMKEGAVLINTARDQCVVEEDVARALRSGRLGAYCTDVYASDPPPADAPILDAPHVYLSPHIGANTKEGLGRIGDALVTLVGDYLSGKA